MAMNINRGDGLSSIQIALNTASNNGDFMRINLPVNGHYRIKIFGIWYAQSNNTHHVVQIQSPQFKFKFPAITNTGMQSVQWPTFISTQAHQVSGLTQPLECEAQLNGILELKLVDLYTGADPANFQNAVFSISLQSIHGEVQQGLF